ncbi:MAG: bifunctional demethylmenaquinone methyltransferase/2-methoxy-6-polyprenyl-1,4-benzoquinol methylase UbiE [Pirellulaceae bacterium]|nr:bifunctional demethylmenaquinone methyltransferase/2-methoxy-6-polyprenyl-1,4-benzoquinol methylase UbiE [Pirellulaceae bacterium]
MPVDKSDQRVQQMFGEIAPRYDLMNHLLSLNVDRYWRWRTVRIVAPSGDRPILDVCTGTGDLALAYYRRAKGRVRVVGTDFCQEMLAVGERKKQRAGIDGNLTFRQADTQRLPFEDNQFQIVSVAFGLRNVSNTDVGLREMVRVCCPGGRVAILEFSMPRWQPMRALYGCYFRHVLPRLGQLIARNSQDAYSYLPESVGEFPSGEQLAQRMRCAGLDRVSVHSFTFGIATLYVGTK